MSDITSTRRRIFFRPGEDLNFLTYNLLIALHELDTLKSPISDLRKLPYLITVISDPFLVPILSRNKGLTIKNHLDRVRLIRAATTARHLRPIMSRLVSALARRNLVSIGSTSRLTTISLCSPNESTLELVEDEVFDPERKNIKIVRKLAPQVKRMSVSTFTKRFFIDYGVQTWDD